MDPNQTVALTLYAVDGFLIFIESAGENEDERRLSDLLTCIVTSYKTNASIYFIHLIFKSDNIKYKYPI